MVTVSFLTLEARSCAIGKVHLRETAVYSRSIGSGFWGVFSEWWKGADSRRTSPPVPQGQIQTLLNFSNLFSCAHQPGVV